MTDQDKKLLALIAGCVTGDQNAWEVFVGEYGRTIRGILVKHLSGEREEINDITQQVFVKLLTGGLKNFRSTTIVTALSNCA